MGSANPSTAGGAHAAETLEQFQLGDGGGPACLIAWDAKRYCSTRGLSQLVDHWFAEEREHSRLLQRHGNDLALRAMCKLILRDEAGHVAFHRNRLAEVHPRGFGCYRSMRFRLLELGAATMLWVNHAPCLKALGATRGMVHPE